MKIEETTIESNSLVVDEGKLYITLGLRDKEHQYSTTGVEVALFEGTEEVIRELIGVVDEDAWTRIRSRRVRLQRQCPTSRILLIGHHTEDIWVSVEQVNR